MRNVFLGATRDYVVEAKDGTQLRVTAAPEANFAPGAQVWLTLPAAACRRAAGVTPRPRQLKSGHFHRAATRAQWRLSTKWSTRTFATTLAPPSSMT